MVEIMVEEGEVMVTEEMEPLPQVPLLQLQLPLLQLQLLLHIPLPLLLLPLLLPLLPLLLRLHLQLLLLRLRSVMGNIVSIVSLFKQSQAPVIVMERLARASPIAFASACG